MSAPDVNKFLEELRTEENLPFGKKLHKLNTFAKSTSDPAFSEKADEFLNSIQPTDFFAKKTRLELANILKRSGPILDALKSDDQLLLHRALQFNWIYSDEDNSPFLQDVDFLVRDLIPEISYSCRRKLINRLGKHCRTPEKVDQIYISVERSYGIDLAKNLLPTCSKEKINKVLSKKHVHLSCNQMARIYKKYPEITIQYLEQSYEEVSKGNYKAWNQGKYFCKDPFVFLLRSICKTSPETFIQLFEKYSPAISDLQFGPRLTNHLLKHGKESILKSSRIYAKLLYQSEVKKRLNSEDYSTFYTNLFPENIRNFQVAFEIGMEGDRGFSGTLYTWLEKLPLKNRFPQLQKSFEKAYSKKIFDFSELITSRIIKILPSEERGKWIDLKLQSPAGPYLYQSTGDIPLHKEGYWEAFRPCNISIEKIKGYLSTEGDVHRRADLLASLVLSCSVNDDKDTLAKVCEYVVSRFRNDSAQVRLEFLSAIENYFDILKLGDEHWIQINELLQISSINNEFSHRSSLMELLLEKSIYYRLKKELPVENQVQQYIKMKTRVYSRGENWRIITLDPKLEKKCLKLFAEQIGLMFPLSIQCSSDSTITSSIISLCESISGWNKIHKKDKMSSKEFPWLMTRLQEILESYHEPNKYRVINALGNDHEARLIFFSKLLTKSPLHPVLTFFLRNEPQMLEENLKSIIGFIVRSNNIEKWSSFFKRLRSQGFLSLCQKIINKCLEIAEDEDDSVKERCNALFIMSFLLKTEHFLEWISKYNPQDGKVDSYSEEAGLAYEFRRAVTKCLNNILVPSQGLSILSHFCTGDYLKLVVGCLYSLCNKSKGSIVLPFLKDLVNRPVSVKKHAIRLVLTFSCKCENIEFLKGLWNSEKNYSIRHIIFKSIFEFYLYDNTQESWDLLESSVKSLTVADHPFLNELGRTDYVASTLMPLDKLSIYLKLSWETVESLGDFGPDSKWVKVSLLQCITPNNITNIDEAFLESIFDKNLFLLKEDPNLQSSLVQVAVNYLLHSNSSKKVDVIGKCLLERLTGELWNLSHKDSPIMFPAKQALSYFVEQLSIESFKVLNNDAKAMTEIFSKLQANLKSTLDPSEFFSDNLFLDFAIVFHSVKVDKSTLETGFQEIGKQIGKLVEETVTTYKGQIIGVFSETLKRFISLCYKYRLIADEGDGARIIWIIDGIIGSSGTIDTQILASHLLLTSNSNLYKGHPVEHKYLDLLNKLKDSKDKTVQIFLNYRLAQSRPICTRGYDVLV